MRTELWGLRDKETHEPILTYWASSQKHKALFSTKEKATAACKWNEKYEPFRIETEPKRGRWVRIVGMAPPEYHWRHTCSCCGDMARDWKFHEELSDFCPHCGADMREVDDA